MLYMTRRLPRCRDLLPRAVLQVINSVSTKMLLTECLPVLVFIGEVVSAISHTHTHTHRTVWVHVTKGRESATSLLRRRTKARQVNADAVHCRRRRRFSLSDKSLHVLSVVNGAAAKTDDTGVVDGGRAAAADEIFISGGATPTVRSSIPISWPRTPARPPTPTNHSLINELILELKQIDVRTYIVASLYCARFFTILCSHGHPLKLTVGYYVFPR